MPSDGWSKYMISLCLFTFSVYAAEEQLLAERRPVGIPTGSVKLRKQVHIAHGVIASATVLIFFPLVAIVLRLISSRHIVRLHWMLQLCNLGLLLIAFGLGCWLSWLDGFLWRKTHQVLGTIIVILFLLQPVIGYVQHQKFLQSGYRSVYSTIHIWYGRGLIVLGIINGGLGLDLAGNATSWQKGLFVIFSLIMTVCYIGVQVWWHFRGRKSIILKARQSGKGIGGPAV